MNKNESNTNAVHVADVADGLEAVANLIGQSQDGKTEGKATGQKLIATLRGVSIRAAMDGLPPEAVQKLVYTGAIGAGAPKGTASTYAKATAGFILLVAGAAGAFREGQPEADAETVEAVASLAILSGYGPKGDKAHPKDSGILAWDRKNETGPERDQRIALETAKAQADDMIARIREAIKPANLPAWPAIYGDLQAVLPALPDAVTMTDGDKATEKAEKARKAREEASKLFRSSLASLKPASADGEADTGRDETGDGSTVAPMVATG